MRKAGTEKELGNIARGVQNWQIHLREPKRYETGESKQPTYANKYTRGSRCSAAIGLKWGGSRSGQREELHFHGALKQTRLGEVFRLRRN
jgi:hypothetical protein